MTKLNILSWNVNSLNKREEKRQLDWFYKEDHDIICFQETMLSSKKRQESSKDLNGYYQYHAFNEKNKGHSGVAIFTKIKPLNIEKNFNGTYEGYGRIIKAEYDNFKLLNVYFPHETAPDCDHYHFYNEFLEYVKNLEKSQVLICGDFNIAHHEKDLKNANGEEMGFRKKQRDLIDQLVGYGYWDTFRELNPKAEEYTFWRNGTKSREGIRGWRLDYFFASNDLNITKAYIRDDIKGSLECAGSDHCPIGVEIKF